MKNKKKNKEEAKEKKTLGSAQTYPLKSRRS